MDKYYAHTDSVRTDSKSFDYYIEVYLAREVDAALKDYEEDNLTLTESATKLCAKLNFEEGVQMELRGRIETLRKALCAVVAEAQGCGSRYSDEFKRLALDSIVNIANRVL